MTNPSVTETTIWRAASELVAGDRIAAGLLPEGEPAEVLFTTAYRLSANSDPFVLVVFRADDSDPDDYHFRADARIPLEALADASGMGYGREADDPRPVSPARVPLHTGGVVDGDVLVDETPCYVPNGFQAPEVIAEREADCAAGHPDRPCILPSGLTRAADESRGVLAGTTPVVTYFSFGHGQTDPDTGKSLLDHYVTVVAPTYEECREAMFASRFGNRWSFDYLAGTARATEWIPRWTEHEVIVAPGTNEELAEAALMAARALLAADEPGLLCMWETGGGSTLRQRCGDPIRWDAGQAVWKHADNVWRGHDAVPHVSAE